MARILCGVMGDAMGHVSQAVALTQALPGHRFLFLGGGQVERLRGTGHAVEPLPMLGTAYRANRVDLAATMAQGAATLPRLARGLARAERAIRHFRPHLVLSLYEVITQLAARRLGLPCLSLDHQHLLTHCRPLGIVEQRTSRALLRLCLAGLTSWADRYLVHSFFPLTPRDPLRVEVFPPLLTPRLFDLRPTAGSHVAIYLNAASVEHLTPALLGWGRPCLIYGVGPRPARGNLIFRELDRRAFLRDLAGCRFLLTNGGHNAISEALYLGKPVLAFPKALAYEQYVNACMLRRLGYGDFCLSRAPGADVLASFEERLGGFRAALAGGDFHGTGRLARRLEQML